MEVYTIGFTKKNAEQFFSALRKAGIKRLVDIRLNNCSQLAGFTKKDDLAFFLREICGADYTHLLILAPTKEILDNYKKKRSLGMNTKGALTAYWLNERLKKKSKKTFSQRPPCFFAVSRSQRNVTGAL